MQSTTTRGGSVHSDADGSPMPDIPHLPEQPLQLLFKLMDAIKALTGEIRQALYAHGAYSAGEGNKQYSALKVEKSRDLSRDLSTVRPAATQTWPYVRVCTHVLHER